MGSKEPANINRFDIYSSSGDNFVPVRGGSPVITYRESVLSPSLEISTTIVDTGNAAPSTRNSRGTISSLEALKFDGPSKVLFDMQDALGNRIRLDGENDLRLKDSGSMSQRFASTTFDATIYSKEHFDNLQEPRYVTQRYSGQVSDIVRNILTTNLRTTKTLDIDATSNPTTFSFEGRRRTPYDCIIELQKIAVPDSGNRAGYLFWQTSDGFKFKSLDKLFDSRGRTIKKYLFNNKVDRTPPRGYDDKILDYSVTRYTDAESQILHGAFSASLETWNSATIDYLVSEPLVSQGEGPENAVISGRNLPDYGEYVESPTAIFTAEQSLSPFSIGDSVSTQIEKSRVQNIRSQDVFLQSKQNYRQKMNCLSEIYIPSDFTLHAGDLVECHFVEISNETTTTISPKDSGIYMILDLCHFISPSKTFTGLKLVRDSFGIRNSG